ncbi:hypothetical protein NPIL_382491 [Nephila pilipes]|uniref:Uncharacterized protein n=1 Tax=Nephila pilipes TaxID=299642 RepID=A0A8X6MZC3_NEPPI|nr:hypothetical protein NPIL_382491 [Nephila pilipes]
MFRHLATYASRSREYFAIEKEEQEKKRRKHEKNFSPLLHLQQHSGYAVQRRVRQHLCPAAVAVAPFTRTLLPICVARSAVAKLKYILFSNTSNTARTIKV